VLHQQTTSTPAVFVAVSDPVETGLVTNLARPGGNLTGFMIWENSIAGKMLEILKQISPGMNRAALIFNPENPTSLVIARWFEAAPSRSASGCRSCGAPGDAHQRSHHGRVAMSRADLDSIGRRSSGVAWLGLTAILCVVPTKSRSFLFPVFFCGCDGDRLTARANF
jgi:hypothetical protein